MKQALGSRTAHLKSFISAPAVSEPAAGIEPALVDARDAARMLSISLRAFHGMRSVLPKPVVLGVRAVRWKTSELRQFVEQLAGTHLRPEPPQLAAGRQAKRALQDQGGDHVAGPNHRPALSKAGSRAAQRPVQSNPQIGSSSSLIRSKV